MTTTFHERITKSTESAHKAAESAEFMALLMEGRLNQAAYLDYLRALLPIYQQMERILRGRQDSRILSYFDHRALDRSSLLEGDIKSLESVLGVGTKEFASVNEYLLTLTDDISDARLLAHHYIRYLGDLSGGQAIAKLVSRHYSITQESLGFYDFSAIGDAVFYKKRYRNLLNLSPFSEQDKSEFLEEVSRLYQLTTNIFLELGPLHKSNKSAIES